MGDHETVKKAAQRLVGTFVRATSTSHWLSFDHRAKVLVPTKLSTTQDSANRTGLLPKVEPQLMKGCDWELRNWQKPKKRNDFPSASLNRRRNEHGDNNRCSNLQNLAGCNLTLNTLGFGDHWNQDIWNKLLMPVEAPCLTFNSQIRQ